MVLIEGVRRSPPNRLKTPCNRILFRLRLCRKIALYCFACNCYTLPTLFFQKSGNVFIPISYVIFVRRFLLGGTCFGSKLSRPIPADGAATSPANSYAAATDAATVHAGTAHSVATIWDAGGNVCLSTESECVSGSTTHRHANVERNGCCSDERGTTHESTDADGTIDSGSDL